MSSNNLKIFVSSRCGEFIVILITLISRPFYESPSHGNRNLTCPICGGRISGNTYEMPCGHQFHRNCYADKLLESRDEAGITHLVLIYNNTINVYLLYPNWSTLVAGSKHLRISILCKRNALLFPSSRNVLETWNLTGKKSLLLIYSTGKNQYYHFLIFYVANLKELWNLVQAQKKDSIVFPWQIFEDLKSYDVASDLIA